MDFLKSGALVELTGTPFAKAFQQEDSSIKTEIRLNISRTNILRPSKQDNEEKSDGGQNDYNDDSQSNMDDYTLSEDDF